MRHSCVLWLAIGLILLAGLSCSRVNPEPETDLVSSLDSLPTVYGELVSVTTSSQYPDWAQLWFVNDEGIIRMVRVEFDHKLIYNDVLVIPRQ